MESSDDEAHDVDDDVSVHSLNLSGMSLSSTASDSPDSPPNSARSLRMIQKKGERELSEKLRSVNFFTSQTQMSNTQHDEIIV